MSRGHLGFTCKMCRMPRFRPLFAGETSECLFLITCSRLLFPLCPSLLISVTSSSILLTLLDFACWDSFFSPHPFFVDKLFWNYYIILLLDWMKLLITWWHMCTYITSIWCKNVKILKQIKWKKKYIILKILWFFII